MFLKTKIHTQKKKKQRKKRKEKTFLKIFLLSTHLRFNVLRVCFVICVGFTATGVSVIQLHVPFLDSDIHCHYCLCATENNCQ